MHRKKYLRMIAAWTMVACMMTVSAGSLTVYAEGAQESERRTADRERGTGSQCI